MSERSDGNGADVGRVHLPFAPPEAPASPAPPQVCRKLRTKMAFGTLEGLARDWREGASSTAVFWCLRTMETWGTDQRPAHAADCRQGRACFEAAAMGDGDDVA